MYTLNAGHVIPINGCRGHSPRTKPSSSFRQAEECGGEGEWDEYEELAER